MYDSIRLENVNSFTYNDDDLSEDKPNNDWIIGVGEQSSIHPTSHATTGQDTSNGRSEIITEG